MGDLPAPLPTDLTDGETTPAPEEFIKRAELLQMVKEIAREAQSTDRARRGVMAPSRWRLLASKLEAPSG